ncbi:hypothetical protein ACFS6H_02225 [Terrimonas rubra]|uniref:DUF7832 domain-containing protein n=1 Tax=Terrimonas rubra TaxID=1035890 RepID=A0ABW6A148_9BACT
MTTYLTKIEEGQTHHFRATVDGFGVDIVQGIFYNFMGKYFIGCGDNASAIKKYNELIAENLKDGFKVTEFKETFENSTDVYDKAKWHYGGDFPVELNYFQGHVHTGMFIGWLIANGLMSEEFTNVHEEEIEAFAKKELTGSQIFERNCDGVLLLEDVSELGNRFALYYFDFSKGQYLNDYDAVLSNDLPTMYHVPDTWENFEKLKPVLDKRFTEWKNQDIQRPFWKYW